MARRRSKRGGSDKAIGLAFAVVGALILAGLVFGLWWVRETKIALDGENCPLKTGARTIHVIMIDRSDPVSGQQGQKIRQYIVGLKDGAAFGTRFDIYTFEGDVKNAFAPVARVCAPGRPEDANELIENPELIRRRFEERFADVLRQSVDSLLQVSTLPNSPIIESIRAAAITSFGPVASGKVSLRLTLISDMIQHSATFSQFRSEPNFAQLVRTPIWPTLQPNLKGAEVEVLYLLRPNALRNQTQIQNRGHQLFWEQLIGASAGHLKSIDPL